LPTTASVMRTSNCCSGAHPHPRAHTLGASTSCALLTVSRYAISVVGASTVAPTSCVPACSL
jgi:hypothetical protein